MASRENERRGEEQQLWSKRFGAPGVSSTPPSSWVTTTGDIYVLTSWNGAVDLGGGPVAATTGDLVAGSFTPSGAHRWSRALPIKGEFLAEVDGCGALVVASIDPDFDLGLGTFLTSSWSPFPAAIARYAP